MDETPTHKPCRVCGTPIAAVARKCPHCWGSQGSWDSIARGVALFLAFVTMLLLIFTFVRNLRQLDPAAPPLASVSIDQPRMFYSTASSGPTVSVLGFLSNTNPFPVANPHFEVRFFDASGDLVDTLSASESALVIPPRSEAAFRVTGTALREQSEYSRFDIRLTQIARARR